MKIVNEYPPNYAQIVSYLGDVESHKPIFCYGDTIYNPFKQEVTRDFEIHEEVHSKQQGDNPHNWWYNYLTDPAFRLEQEIEAYGTQYAYAKTIAKREITDWLKENFARALSGSLYGNLLTYHQAESRINKYSKQWLDQQSSQKNT